MSLNIRYLSNGEKEVFTVRNSGVTPAEFDIYNKREDIPESIRHYAPKTSQFCLPDLARVFGVLDLFYPNLPKDCILPGHSGKPCIFESCKYSEYSKEAERETCPRVLSKQSEGLSE